MPPAAQPTPRGAAPMQDEICPVCTSSRYLNANLRLLVNPECYHKMCESCVDRLFSHGPKPCPIPGCGKTLRKARFRKQTFEDMVVEREVDIRRRVAAIFNRREEDFETLRDWNDYLNDVEDITFNLVNRVDVEETEQRLEKHRLAHSREIKENASLAQQETMSYSELQKADKAQAKQRREAARREEAEERAEVEEAKRDALKRLENGQDPETVAQEVQGPALKKRMNRQAAADRQALLNAASKSNANGNGSSDVLIRGLKKKTKAVPEAPVDPFGGLSYEGRQYFAVQDDYSYEGLRTPRNNPLISAGGYEMDAFRDRTLLDAFAGLGVFIADETSELERLATVPGAAEAVKRESKRSQDVQMEDPF